MFLPGGEVVVEAGPLDEVLRHRAMMTRTHASLKDALWHLESFVDVGQRRKSFRRRSGCRGWLQEEDMEDLVHRGTWRKELVSDITNLVDDLVGAEELEAQFLMRLRSQRGLNIWLETQVDKVANLECALISTLVGIGLHTLLSAE
jgi:hypothetical protein